MPKLSRVSRIFVPLASYCLGASMMLYAVSKLLNWQFQVAAYDYTLPLSRTSGIQLTWALYGYQPWYQRLLGLAEFAPSVLLLFNRTRRLGALLFLPVALNVMLTNFALNLWPETKVISFIMLAVDVCLIMTQLRQYAAALRKLLQPVEPAVSPFWRRIEVISAALVITGITLFTYIWPHSMQDPIRDFVGDRQINGAGSWAVESIRIAGRPVLASNQSARLYFDIWHKVFFTLQKSEPCVSPRQKKDANPTWTFTVISWNTARTASKMFHVKNQGLKVISRLTAGNTPSRSWTCSLPEPKVQSKAVILSKRIACI